VAAAAAAGTLAGIEEGTGTGNGVGPGLGPPAVWIGTMTGAAPGGTMTVAVTVMRSGARGRRRRTAAALLEAAAAKTVAMVEEKQAAAIGRRRLEPLSTRCLQKGKATIGQLLVVTRAPTGWTLVLAANHPRPVTRRLKC